MSQQHPRNVPSTLPLEAIRHINQVCDRFEAAWQDALAGRGPAPCLEDYLQGANESVNASLLRELVALDTEYRQQGATPRRRQHSPAGDKPPPPASGDRNLLFGILAVQMDFIRRAALLAAMHAWVLDKSKPLGHILRDLGHL